MMKGIEMARIATIWLSAVGSGAELPRMKGIEMARLATIWTSAEEGSAELSMMKGIEMARLAIIEGLSEAALGRNSAGLWSVVTAGLARAAAAIRTIRRVRGIRKTMDSLNSRCRFMGLFTPRGKLAVRWEDMPAARTKW